MGFRQGSSDPGGAAGRRGRQMAASKAGGKQRSSTGVIAARLTEARQRAGVAQHTVEQHCGLGNGYWAHMIRAPGTLRLVTLKVVAAALDVSAEWLVQGTGGVGAVELPGFPVTMSPATALVGAKALARDKGRPPELVLKALLKLGPGGPNESAKWWYQRLTAELDGVPLPRRPGRAGATRSSRDMADLDLLAYLELSGPVFARLASTSPNRLAAAWSCVERGRDKRAIRDVLLMKAPDGATDVAGWMRIMDKRQETYHV